MNSVLISGRILQTDDIYAFSGTQESSLSPITAASRPLVPKTPSGISMALTVLVLLTAFFFMGFFSVYIRRSAADTEATPNQRSPLPKVGGLDASAVNSLPLVAYGTAAKHPMINDCPICLCEFHDTETVKLIPYCSHVFHPSCLDTWLASHVTCPMCRSAQLFSRVEEVRVDVVASKNVSRAPDIVETSTVERSTRGGTRAAGVRRTLSCSDIANRAVLQRTTSF